MAADVLAISFELIHGDAHKDRRVHCPGGHPPASPEQVKGPWRWEYFACDSTMCGWSYQPRTARLSGGASLSTELFYGPGYGGSDCGCKTNSWVNRHLDYTLCITSVNSWDFVIENSRCPGYEATVDVALLLGQDICDVLLFSPQEWRFESIPENRTMYLILKNGAMAVTRVSNGTCSAVRIRGRAPQGNNSPRGFLCMDRY